MSNRTQWLADLPPSWRPMPLKAVAAYAVSSVDKIPQDGEILVRLCNYTDVYNNEFIDSGLNFMPSTATEDEIKKFRIHVDDVIITKDSESWDDIAVPALVTETANDLICGYHLAILRPAPGRLLGRFLFRCLQAKPIRVQLELASATGVTRFGIPKHEIGRLLLPIPPVAQQRAIADFLDRETNKIDDLIAKKARLHVLLNTAQMTTISEAVSGGLISRGTGRWPQVRLRFLLHRIEQGWSPQCETRPADPDEWGVVKAGCVNGIHFDQDENKVLPPTVEPETRFEIKAGDVLVSRANTRQLLGSAALVREVRPRLLLCDKLYRLFCKPNLTPEFLVYSLRSFQARFQIEREATGTSGSMQNVGQDTLQNLVIAVPSEAEQADICRYINAKTRAIGDSSAQITAAIALLREYRSSLISAAVTGQLDIR